MYRETGIGGYSFEFVVVALTHKVGVDSGVGVGVDSGGSESESESPGNPSTPQPCCCVCLCLCMLDQPLKNYLLSVYIIPCGAREFFFVNHRDRCIFGFPNA